MNKGRLLLSSLTITFCVTAATLLWALHTGTLVVPERWNPWAPLSLDQAPNWLTRYKLARASRDDAVCLATLEQADMRYTPVPDRDTGPECGFRNAVRISATSARVGEAFSLSCRGALSLALWEQHVLQPVARARFGQPVSRLEHYGSYACRNVYGRENARRSRHASADALDVAGFVLQDGRRIRVAADWRDGSERADFLREVHRGACRFFDGVLGPDYNTAHHDHFHLDRGGPRICR